MTPTLTLTTAMQLLPLTAATSFEHRGPQCLLTLDRSTTPPPLDQFPVRVCSCPLCIINRLCLQGARSRSAEDAVVARAALSTLAHACGLPPPFLIDGSDFWRLVCSYIAYIRK